MKKGQIYEGVVERLDFPNKGFVCVDTEEGCEYATVKDALPGRRVRFVVTKRRSGKAEGRLKEVLEKAACETGIQACIHAGICGGCLYQGFPYEETLRVKEEQVKRLLEGYVEDAVYEGIVGSPETEGYRNKMEYTFGDEYMDGPLALGLHKRGSFYDILSVPDCRIANTDFGRILAYTLDFFSRRAVPYYHRMKHSGLLRHLLVRGAAGSGELLVGLVSCSRDSGAVESEASSKDGAAEAEDAHRQWKDGIDAQTLAEWKDGLLELPLDGKFAGILHIVNDSLADAVKCDHMEILYGEDHFTEHILELSFRVSTFSFFQTNSYGAEKLYSMARDFLRAEGIHGTVYDLYSGTGTIAQLLSPAAEHVVGVEIVEEAVEAARVASAQNGITNCEFIAGDVLKVLDDITVKPDMIVLDPPRDGVHPKALQKILGYGVDNILYISCKPTSLARDMAAIREAGYGIVRWGMVDMFPYTGNVETVVLLGWKGVDDYMYVDYAPDHYVIQGGKATYKEITEWIQNTYGVHVTNLNIAQIKDKCGFDKRENYNKGAEGHKVPNCTPEKEEMIIEAFKHFRMI